ncbi:MAG: hypothetical protein K1X67_15985 [Fimbriimonadaceae bacterium]|nr:hypothetical protein [Fimbriimonadaceae bacterium]
MNIPFPRTKSQWIATGILVVVVVLFLYFFTGTFRGQAVEVSVENASLKPVFVYIDNTGRHGENTPTIKLRTTTNAETPSGLLIQPGTTRSFGTAVGLGDSPTLHVLPVTGGGLVDNSGLSDCVFDTISLKKLEIPSLHVKLKWTGAACEAQR